MSEPEPLSVPLTPLPASATITAKSGSNLALAFRCLPPENRRAMGIFYAFCRVVDDASDSETMSLAEKQAELAFWREEIRRAYVGEPLSPLGREMAEVIKTYLIPPDPLEEILNGVETDLSLSRHADFGSLEQYCYRVASAVGLVSIEIFGCRQPRTKDYAIALGMAFQLTNILRDVKKDAANGRIYLPLDELAEFGLTENDVLEGNFSPAMRRFLRFQRFRARHYYAKALRLIDPADRPRLEAAEIMREVYQSLLDKLDAQDGDVFTHRIALSKLEKLLCIRRAMKREKKAAPLPPPPKRVLVLGGGFAGVAAALELLHSGHAVTLLESKPALGGRASSFREAQSGETLDTGQHLMMGCYDETLDFLETLGTRDKLARQDRLDVPFASPRGFSRLRALPLPAPFHLLGALCRYREIGWRDRFAALRLALRLRRGQRPLPEETATEWLKRWNQPPRLIAALWEPMCLAALNRTLNGSAATLLATVLERALLSSGEGSVLIASRVGLSELLDPGAEILLDWCDGQILRGAHVNKLLFQEGRCVGAETLDGRAFRADHVVSALPWNAMRGLLPAESPAAANCAKIPDSPIVSLHFWLDRPIFEEQSLLLGFLDSPLHWLFDRQEITGETSKLGHAYVAVISAAVAEASQNAAAIEEEVMRELRRFLPKAQDARVTHRFLYKARAATFAATPEVEPLRPETATQWPGLWLAGDWTNTGLPGTLEGAVWSGRRAAKAVDAA